MMPEYLPGDVLRMPEGSLWLVVHVIPAGPIYTLHAQSSMQRVSVTRSGRELERLHPVKVARSPEETRAAGIAEALDRLAQGTERESVLAGLWNLAFTTGLGAREQDPPGAARR